MKKGCVTWTSEQTSAISSKSQGCVIQASSVSILFPPIVIVVVNVVCSPCRPHPQTKSKPNLLNSLWNNMTHRCIFSTLSDRHTCCLHFWSQCYLHVPSVASPLRPKSKQSTSRDRGYPQQRTLRDCGYPLPGATAWPEANLICCLENPPSSGWLWSLELRFAPSPQTADLSTPCSHDIEQSRR